MATPAPTQSLAQILNDVETAQATYVNDTGILKTKQDALAVAQQAVTDAQTSVSADGKLLNDKIDAAIAALTAAKVTL